MTALLDSARLPAVVAGVAAEREFASCTAGADLVFAPVRIRQHELLGPGNAPVEELFDPQTIMIFANAASEVELDVQPDDSNHAALAAAHDRAEELLTRANDLSEVAGTLIVSAEMLRMTAGDDQRLNALADEAAATAAKAQRKYLDARTRAEKAKTAADAIDPSFGSDDVDQSHWITARAQASSRSRET